MGCSLDVGDVIAGVNGHYFTASFSAKAPFDSSKSDSLDLGSLSGLTAGTQAHLALGWSYWSPIPAHGVDDIVAFQRSPYFAQLYGGFQWVTPTVPGGPTLRKAAVALKLGPTPLTLITDKTTYLQIVAELNKEIDAYNSLHASEAGFQRLQSVVPLSDYEQIAQRATSSYFQTVARYAPSWIPTIALTLDGNQQSFSYASASDPTKVTKEDKDGKGASLVVSVLRQNWLASLSYAYTKTYTAQPSSQICTPIAGTTSSQCVNGVIGAPKEKVGRLCTAEYRVRVASSFAVSPQVQYSQTDSKWGVSVPVYLTADSNRILNGGVTLGWTADKHFAAAIFVGKPFSF